MAEAGDVLELHREAAGLTEPASRGTCVIAIGWCTPEPWRGGAVPALINLRRDVVFQPHPSGSDREENGFTCGKSLALAHRFDPQQRQTETVAARPHFADFAPIRCYDCSGRRGRPVDPDWHQPLFDEPAILRPRRQFLADIAALLPVDAVQFVEACFEQDRFLQYQIAAAVGNAERQPQPVVAVGTGFGDAGIGEKCPCFLT